MTATYFHDEPQPTEPARENPALCGATRAHPWCGRCGEWTPPFPDETYRLPCERHIADEVAVHLEAQ